MAEKRPSLNVLSGPLAGRKLVLQEAIDNILIGSDPSCAFVLDTPGISPVHARLWVDLHGATVYDTNSPTGVYLNDDRVVKEASVRNGDILWLGPPGEEGSVLIQCILPSPAASAPAPAAAPPADEEAVDDSSSTMAFGVPAYLPDELEGMPLASGDESAASSAPSPSDAEADATVVMSHAEFSPPPIPDPEPTVARRPDDPADLIEEAGLDVDGPTVVLAAPLASAGSFEEGFPEFEVEPTVAMAAPTPPMPPPIPMAATPRGATPEFEDEIGQTVIDAPSPVAAASATFLDDEASPTVISHQMDEPEFAPDPIPPLPSAPAAPPPVPEPPPLPRASVRAPAAAAPSAPAARPPKPSAALPSVAAPASRAAVRPAAAAPRARAERPAPAPAPLSSSTPARRSGGRGALIVASAVVVSALAFAGYWFLRPAPAANPPTAASPIAAVPETQPTPLPATAETVPSAPQTLAAAPVAPPTATPEAVTIVRSPVPSPRVAAVPPTTLPARPGAAVPGQRPPTPAPVAPVVAAPNPAQQTAAAVASLMGQAQTASTSRNYDAAVSLYDEVLKLDPQNAGAVSGRTAALAARNAAHRTFVAGRTVVQTEKAKAEITGFDSSDVSVRKNPDFQGRIELAMTPANVKAGDAYKLQVTLVNEGKKPIKVSGMTYTITVNGQKTGNPVAPRVKEVAPSQRVVLEELPGVFPEANSWMAEVLVTANKGDSLKNQITWK